MFHLSKCIQLFVLQYVTLNLMMSAAEKSNKPDHIRKSKENYNSLTWNIVCLNICVHQYVDSDSSSLTYSMEQSPS